jgi:hypothetical protein
MSDAPSGPGWWKASDGRWYPPESADPNLAPPTQVMPAAAPVGPVGPVPPHAVPPPLGNPWQRFRATPPWFQGLGWAIAAVVLLLIIVVAARPDKPTQRLQVGTGPTIIGADTTTSTTAGSTTPSWTAPPDSGSTAPGSPAASAVPAAAAGPAGATPTTTAATGTTTAPVAVTTTTPHGGTTTTIPTTTTSSSTTVAPDLCGAPPNPLHYTFCPPGGQYIVQPDPATCQYFKPCVDNFFDGDPNPPANDYMVQCGDGFYSMSGGQPGACAGHKGVKQKVYLGP